ncbi:MAG: hypothetical protein ACXW35_10535, partial [Nitrospira sp.]
PPCAMLSTTSTLIDGLTVDLALSYCVVLSGMVPITSTRPGWAANPSVEITTLVVTSIDKNPIDNMLFILMIASL